MIRNHFLRKLFTIQRNAVTVRPCTSKLGQLNIQNLDNEELPEVIDDELRQREEELEHKRNKSRLKAPDYNMLHEINPYPEPTSWHHGTLKYMRRTYGRYGKASGVDPAICWPTKQEIEKVLEYEKIKYPYTIPEMIQAASTKRQEKQKRILERQEDIVKKMAKLEQWKQELHERISKRESEAIAARLRRERLIEEVKRHFGYTVDPKEDRFKEMLEKKEKEQKKLMKEARKKAKEEKMLQRTVKKKDSSDGEVNEGNEPGEKTEKVE